MYTKNFIKLVEESRRTFLNANVFLSVPVVVIFSILCIIIFSLTNIESFFDNCSGLETVFIIFIIVPIIVYCIHFILFIITRNFIIKYFADENNLNIKYFKNCCVSSKYNIDDYDIYHKFKLKKENNKYFAKIKDNILEIKENEYEECKNYDRALCVSKDKKDYYII